MMGEDMIVLVPRLVMQAVFDTAVNSMNFAAGFLDSEEVEALRKCAGLLGVDPAVGTPSNYWDQYGLRGCKRCGALLNACTHAHEHWCPEK